MARRRNRGGWNLRYQAHTLIDLGALEPGTYRYTCGMGMYGGSNRVVA